jgi:hypothetical protein
VIAFVRWLSFFHRNSFPPILPQKVQSTVKIHFGPPPPVVCISPAANERRILLTSANLMPGNQEKQNV